MSAEVPQLSPPSSRGSPIPPKLVVLAVDTGDAVSAAGGLIFDLTRAGWIVEVYLETVDDQRALRVLGVDPRPLPAGFDFESQWPDAVYFAAALYERDGAVRRLIVDATRRRRADIADWGDSAPAAEDHPGSIDHRLSSAAQAFKSSALKVAGLAAQVLPSESFRSGERRHDAEPR